MTKIKLGDDYYTVATKPISLPSFIYSRDGKKVYQFAYADMYSDPPCYIYAVLRGANLEDMGAIPG